VYFNYPLKKLLLVIPKQSSLETLFLCGSLCVRRLESLKSEERTMADVMVMKEIQETAQRLGIDLASVDLDAIRLPPGQDFGIVR
jgi:hypothetical protein